MLHTLRRYLHHLRGGHLLAIGGPQPQHFFVDFSRRTRFTSTLARYEALACLRSHRNRSTGTRIKISPARNTSCRVHVPHTICSSSPAMVKTARIWVSSASHCHKTVNAIYFFDWDSSPTNRVLIILFLSTFSFILKSAHQMPDSHPWMIQQHSGA